MTQKPLLDVLAGNIVAPPPLWLMRQAGRYLPEYRETRKHAGDFLTLCYTPDLATEVTLQPIRRFSFDAAIIFSDILVISHALGMQLDYIEGKGPVLDPLTHKDGIAALSLDRLEEHLAPVGTAISQVTAELPAHTTMIGFAGAPWTVATYMLEGGSSKNFAKAKGLGYRDPESFSTLLNTLVEATVRYLHLQITAGAEVIQLFDSWAGVLGEQEFADWVIAPTKAIIAGVKAQHPDIPIIGFPKGAGLHYPRYIAETGVTAVGLDYTMPSAHAAETLQSKLPVQGNLDPVLLAEDEAAMRVAVSHIKQAFSRGPHIFNLGHGILPHTPIAHVEALIEAVKSGTEEGKKIA